MRVVRQTQFLRGGPPKWWWSVALEVGVLIAVFVVIGVLVNSKQPGSSPSLPPGAAGVGVAQVPITPCGGYYFTPCAPKPANSFIAGTIFLDDKPAAGFSVSLDAGGGAQTTGISGGYKFGGLGAGGYTVRVSYDKTKVAPVTSDFSLQTVDGNSGNSGIDFRFKSLVTPSPSPVPTTPTSPGKSFNPSIALNPTAGPPGAKVDVNGSGWNPRGPTGGPNTVTVVFDNATASGAVSGLSTANAPIAVLGIFQVRSDGTFVGQAAIPTLPAQAVVAFGTDENYQRARTNFTIQAAPVSQTPQDCNANTPAGQKLRITTCFVQTSNTSFRLVVGVVAGADGVNLNDTVIVNLPAGATASQISSSTGTVNITGNVVRWGGFSLAPQQEVDLALSVNAPGGSLDGSSLFVSGRFNRGLAFQQRILGLPPLTEIDPGQGGASVPAGGAPSTGIGPKDDSLQALIVGLLIAAWILTLGGLIGWRMVWRKRQR